MSDNAHFQNHPGMKHEHAVIIPHPASQLNPGGIFFDQTLNKTKSSILAHVDAFLSLFCACRLLDIERLNSVQDFNRATLCRHYSHEDSQDDR